MDIHPVVAVCEERAVTVCLLCASCCVDVIFTTKNYPLRL